MRIISGKLKGFRLNRPTDIKIRPTTDRFKETLFSIILSEKFSESLSGKNFLDLCSGSGSIGLEAFSRGAKKIFLIDKEKKAINLIRKNVYKLKLNDQLNKNIFVIQRDFRELDSLDLPKFNFVFFDPPYNENLYREFLLKAEKIKIFDSNTVIFVETNVELNISELKYNKVFSKKISSSYLYCFKINLNPLK